VSIVVVVKRLLILCFLAAIVTGARAGSLDDDILSSDAKKPKKPLHAVLAKDKDSQPTNKFAADTPKISAFWKGENLKLGNRLHAVWVAEDIGVADRKDTTITDAWIIAYKADDDGAFALARPKEGWPAGKYRFDLYVENKLVETLPFTIEPSATVEVH
jgi:hypothetical protein